jgi:hypothetical protein
MNFESDGMPPPESMMTRLVQAAGQSQMAF